MKIFLRELSKKGEFGEFGEFKETEYISFLNLKSIFKGHIKENLLTFIIFYNL